jgi:hypothetical protein
MPGTSVAMGFGRASPRPPKLGEVHIAPLVDGGVVMRTAVSELVADIGQPCSSPVPLNQMREPQATVAVATCTADLKTSEDAFEITQCQ